MGAFLYVALAVTILGRYMRLTDNLGNSPDVQNDGALTTHVLFYYVPINGNDSFARVMRLT